MTNRERYKRAFSAIQVPDDFCLEGIKMKQVKKQRRLTTIAATAAVCAVLVGSAAAAYTVDAGGIQRMVQLWLNGDQTQVEIQFDGNGTYTMEYTDHAGERQEQSGGGVVIAPDGSERPATEEELLEHLSRPDVRYEEDGSVWVYWYDQKVDITDSFVDGVCYVKLVHGDETLYLTVEYGNGWSSSPHKYLEPDSRG